MDRTASNRTTNGVQTGYRPFIEFFDRRLPDVRIISEAEYNPVITDTFIVVPNPPSKEEAKNIRIIFQEND